MWWLSPALDAGFFIFQSNLENLQQHAEGLDGIEASAL
jgi:hypothetical protein